MKYTLRPLDNLLRGQPDIIPDGTTHLTIDGIHGLNQEQLDKIYAATQSTVDKLGFDVDHLHAHPEIAKSIFSKMPSSVTTLYLKKDIFSHKKDNFRALSLAPETVKAVYLRWEFLPRNKPSAEEFASVFPYFNKSITTLGLNANLLHADNMEQLARIAAQIPESVTTFVLYYEPSDYHPGSRGRNPVIVKRFAHFLGNLPKHVLEIRIDLRDIQDFTEEELIALGKKLTHITAITVLNENNEPVSHPSVDILRKYMGSAFLEAPNVLHERTLPESLTASIEESHSFKLKLLSVLAAASAISLLIALFVSAPLSIGLASFGVCGILTAAISGYGLFRAHDASNASAAIDVLEQDETRPTLVSV